MHRGTLGGREVVAIVTGMGTELATAGIERLLDAVDVDHVLVVGITGAVEDETPIGTLVRPEVVVLGASGREHRPTRIGDAEHEGRMWTTDTLTTDLDELAELRAQGRRGARHGDGRDRARRASSAGSRGRCSAPSRDRASDGTVDAEVFAMSNQDGTPNEAAITAFFEKYPERIPMLAQMAEDSTLATERAAAAAIAAAAALIPPDLVPRRTRSAPRAPGSVPRTGRRRQPRLPRPARPVVHAVLPNRREVGTQ